MKELLRIKSVKGILDETASGENALKKSLGIWDLICIGVASVVGTGIFAVIGTAVAGNADHPGAGTGVIISFILAAAASLFTMLCYAEFASMIPVSGSAYTYSYASIGELPAWIMGWVLTLEYGISAVAVAISWGEYLKLLLAGFGMNIPEWLSVSIAGAMSKPEILAAAPHIGPLPITFNLPAFLIIIAISLLLIRGIKESAVANNIIVCLKMGILLFFVIAGSFYVKPEHWSPFLPNGFQGVLAATSVIFFAYIGLDAISTAAEETKNPAKNIPLGMIWTLVASSVIYIIIAVVLTGMAPASALGTADPLARAFEINGISWAAGLICAGAVVAMASVILVTMMGQTRIFYVISRDGLLPKSFSKVHPKYKTPYVVTLWVGAIAAFAAGFADIGLVVDLCNIGTLFSFAVVCAGVLMLRKTDPDRERPFKCPGMPFVPAVGILLSVLLMIPIPLKTWVLFGIWLLAGAVIYFVYGAANSSLRDKSADKKEILKKMLPYSLGCICIASVLALLLILGIVK